ncbi:MAG: hypothetical protein IKO95_08610 [Spirochaetia bacterium]|nr:hypothetical protein [Spirochaetia bacterium]
MERDIWERKEVYKSVDRALDIIEDKVAALCQKKASHYTLLAYLGGTSIAELMINGTL